MTAPRTDYLSRELGTAPPSPPLRAGPISEARVRQLIREELETMLRAKQLPELEARVTINLCIKAAALVFDATVDEIVGKRRTAPLVQARHAAMWAARKFTKASYPAIGNRFGGRDHSTVIHGIDHAEELCGEDPDFAFLVAELDHAIAKAVS